MSLRFDPQRIKKKNELGWLRNCFTCDASEWKNLGRGAGGPCGLGVGRPQPQAEENQETQRKNEVSQPPKESAVAVGS